MIRADAPDISPFGYVIIEFFILGVPPKRKLRTKILKILFFSPRVSILVRVLQRNVPLK